MGGHPGMTRVVLTGQRWVTLEPLAVDHVDEIADAAADVGDLWFARFSARNPSVRMNLLR
ncbi:MAG: hypothetical protein ACSLE7_02055 [Mycobacterium sp.]